MKGFTEQRAIAALAVVDYLLKYGDEQQKKTLDELMKRSEESVAMAQSILAQRMKGAKPS